MSNIGKTSKKNVSSAQQEYKSASRQQRIENLADVSDWITGAKTEFGIRPTAHYQGQRTITRQAKKQGKAESKYRRMDQQAGRMSFTKDRVPYALRPVMKDASQLDRYITEKHRDTRWKEPSVATEALDRAADRRGIGSTRTTPLTKTELEFIQAARGGTPLPVSPAVAGRSMAGKAPVTRNRARGRTVTGMMAGPLLAGLGDYIGRNTSVGQQLRSQMMKQQPSRNR
jgi:hypothetical protein